MSYSYHIHRIAHIDLSHVSFMMSHSSRLVNKMARCPPAHARLEARQDCYWHSQTILGVRDYLLAVRRYILGVREYYV